MGGELEGPGGEAPCLGHGVQGWSGGGAPRFTSARRPNGAPGACPRFGRLG